MQQPYTNSRTTLISTACGTILSLFNHVSAQEIIKTATLAAIGAIVSFIISITAKFIFRKLSRKK